MCMIQKFISVTSHALDISPLSQTVTPSRTPSPLERDVLYGRPPISPPPLALSWTLVGPLSWSLSWSLSWTGDIEEKEVSSIAMLMIC